MNKRNRRIHSTVGFALLLSCLPLGGCHHVAANPAGVDLTAWSIRTGGLQARVQVRLAPRAVIHDAVLEAASPRVGVVIRPPAFTFATLSPPAYPKNQAHNPPALGRTTLRTFAVSVRRPGDYPLRVSLRWQGHVETRLLTLHFPGSPGR